MVAAKSVAVQFREPDRNFAITGSSLVELFQPQHRRRRLLRSVRPMPHSIISKKNTSIANREMRKFCAESRGRRLQSTGFAGSMPIEPDKSA
jgi:hypothetical protein